MGGRGICRITRGQLVLRVQDMVCIMMWRIVVLSRLLGVWRRSIELGDMRGDNLILKYEGIARAA